MLAQCARLSQQVLRKNRGKDPGIKMCLLPRRSICRALSEGFWGGSSEWQLGLPSRGTIHPPPTWWWRRGRRSRWWPWSLFSQLQLSSESRRWKKYFYYRRCQCQLVPSLQMSLSDQFYKPLITPHWTENSKQIFPEMKLCGSFLNRHRHQLQLNSRPNSASPFHATPL